MSKTIQFSAEEINELRSFYSNELATAEERIKHIRAILAKISASANGRDKKSGITNAGPIAIDVPSPVKKKRGRPATKNKKTTDEVNAAPKKRGRPAKAKSSDAPVSATSGKKRGRKPKLQLTQPNADSIVSAVSNAAPTKGKKRGRKPLSATKASSDASIGTDKAQITPVTTGAKRGRKPGKKIENSATKLATELKAVATSKKDKTKTVAKVSGAKRGRKPSLIGKATSDAASPEAKTVAPEANAIVNKKAPKSNSAKADVKKVAKKPAAVKVSKAKPSEKAVKDKVVKAAPAKVVSVKKSAAKESKKITPAEKTKNQVKVEVAPKKVSKKELYQELIFKTFASEPRFYTTEEILNAGIKEFNLKGKEKDAAKNTMQFILNGLQSQSKILRRRKEKDRQAYWASLETSDEGYIQ
jgi:hypothetical protein